MNEPPPVSAHELPLGPGVRLIEVNEDGLVALEKPAGVMSHPNADEDRERAVLDAAYDLDEEVYTWPDESGTERRAWLINRLDSPTSGVLLLALSAALSTEIKNLFATHKVEKTYYALVKRPMRKPAGVWSDVLTKTVVRQGKRIEGGKRVPAKTHYQMVKVPTGGFPVTLVKLMPITGRTHQLRVQCKQHQHPIVGDRTYGSFSFNKEVALETGEKRMMLHSAETKVKYAFRGKAQTFVARSEIPQAFQTVLNFRPGLNTGRRSSASLANRRFRRPQT